MKTFVLALVVLMVTLATGFDAHAQSSGFDRLDTELFEVTPPSARVSGPPGQMSVRQTTCQSWPMEQARRRIVDVAVQEWAFFGFSISDQTRTEARGPRSVPGVSSPDAPRTRRRFRTVNPEEAARVADSIAGYWAVTPDGTWILDRQNSAWNGSRGIASRWRDPWSAAFISWVVCEAGLASNSQFQRAIAHHTYIDQAIRTRDGSRQGAFAAYDIGETSIEPGDLLCSARRPGYDSLADRRRQMGEGARTHCDVVVKVDAQSDRILTIGGNVRGTVGMKLMPAIRENGRLRPRSGLFAHLKLRADPIEANALDNSPTVRTMGCTGTFTPPTQLVAANVTRTPTPSILC